MLRFIESSHFTLFHCISYLERYSDEIGIHFHLCQKIRSYPNEDIEFFIPQLVQLHVTVQTESAALEDLIVDLCNRSTHCAVLIFWQVQAHLSELSDEPESYGFQGCQRLMAKLHHILFNVGAPPDPKIRENCSPGFVLAASVLGGVGMPGMVSHIKPLVVSQGRKRRTHIFQIANKLMPTRVPSLSNLRLTNSSAPNGLNRLQNDGDEEQDLTLDSPISARSLSFSTNRIYNAETESRSLPNLAIGSFRRASSMKSLRSVNTSKDSKNVEILKSNYFRCETQFMTALHTISTRLVSVPKQARLSALRIEIAMLNKDLPAEVDIPLLIPTTRFSSADQPFPAQPKQHKLLRICPAEAVLLNSAERVPYLLLVEFLRNEVDFDPHSSANKHLLTEEIDRRHIFDTLSTAHTPHLEDEELDTDVSNDNALPPEEKDMGDISVINLYDNKRDIHTQESLSASVTSISRYTNLLSNEENSPRSSDLSFSPAYSLPITGDEDISDIATHMRTAAVMITQLDGAGANKLPKEEVARIKAKIIASMQSMEEHTIYRTDIMAGEAGDRKMENDLKTTGMDDSREGTNLNLGEEWLVRKERIRKASPFGHLPNWDLFSVIVKTGDDLRQEAFACQLIQAMQMCWKKAQTGVWVKQYNILITHNSAGLVETITNALSIHSIKKAMTTASVKAGKNPKGAIPSLRQYFELTFGKGRKFDQAVDCFVRSLASYSIICYILQIKDRHNGNILLDNEGHVNHIDFGFLLSNAPGGFGFETAPFKLTHEYVELMGGVDSAPFQLFKDLLKQAFKDLRKEADSIIILVEMMQRGSSLPCFTLGAATATMLKQRFQLHLSEQEVDAFVETGLIAKSLGNISTRIYDHYQLLTQGIYS